MKCQDCPDYKNDICEKAQKSLSLMVDPVCLQKAQIMLLRSIWEELVWKNDKEDEGDDWKL